ncbi:hypothetical protein FTO70_12605 [Methanosarcina sp. KYL-1]|nr:hypothetical protein [Methanosarcina sp. KYL-1]
MAYIRQSDIIFVYRLFIVCLSFVYRLFIVCLSFVYRLSTFCFYFLFYLLFSFISAFSQESSVCLDNT